jgi:hypothetical protein
VIAILFGFVCCACLGGKKLPPKEILVDRRDKLL